MSLYKIDGHIMSVDEMVTWIGGFITLSRQGRLEGKKIPAGAADILKNGDDKKVLKEMMVYLKSDEDFMPVMMDIVRKGVTDIAFEGK